MKRSEAVKQLGEHLHLMSVDTEIGVDWWTIVAEVAISKLESMEMSPPINKEKSFMLGKDGQMVYEWREWDEEGSNGT